MLVYVDDAAGRLIGVLRAAAKGATDSSCRRWGARKCSASPAVEEGTMQGLKQHTDGHTSVWRLSGTRSYIAATLLAMLALGITRALEGPLAGLFFFVPIVVIVLAGLLGTVGSALMAAVLCTGGIAVLFDPSVSGFRVAHAVETYRLLGFVATAALSAILSGTVSSAFWRVRTAWLDAEAARIGERQAHEKTHRIREVQERVMAVVAHELRTPLSSISLASRSMLSRGTLAAATRQRVERIASSADRMTHLLSDLVDYARAQRGERIPLELSELDLGEVCHLAVEEIRLTHPERDITLSVDGVLRSKGDAHRLVQVISNLIGNAVQHGSSRSAIEVCAREDADALRIEVHNDGAPIPPDMLPFIFEPFRRGRLDTTGARSGSAGLGLYIVREIVLAHGGTVEVSSCDGGGTTVTVRLPALTRAPTRTQDGALTSSGAKALWVAGRSQSG